jgi:serine protease Do
VMGPQLAEFFGVEGNAGLLVRSVQANSPAEDAGLRAGDVVIQVNQVPVTTASEWSKTIHQNRGKQVVLQVLRDRHEQTMTLTPDSKKRSSVVWPLVGADCAQIAEL